MRNVATCSNTAPSVLHKYCRVLGGHNKKQWNYPYLPRTWRKSAFPPTSQQELCSDSLSLVTFNLSFSANSLRLNVLYRTYPIYQLYAKLIKSTTSALGPPCTAAQDLWYALLCGQSKIALKHVWHFLLPAFLQPLKILVADSFHCPSSTTS